MSVDLHFRTLTKQDLADAMRLKTIAGWNQTEEDWIRFLDMDPEGTFAACMGENVVATGSTVIYQGRVAWIGMILVDPEYRRLGIGTKMLHHCIAYLQSRNVPAIKLDATPMGQPVYEKIGFLAEYGAARWEGRGIEVPETPESDECLIRPLAADDAEALRQLDSPVFGADRTDLLLSCLKDHPECAGAVWQGDELAGFVLARIGTDAHHIGPLVARDSGVAGSLLYWAIKQRRRDRIFIDILTDNPLMSECLTLLGMKEQRPFLRMYLGENHYPGQPELVYAMAGPELG